MSSLAWPLRQRLYEQASAQLDNGRNLTGILAAYRDSLRRRRQSRAAESVHQLLRQVRDGKNLTVALDAELTPLERGVLGAGEASGQLAQAMRLILEVHAITSRLRRHLVGTLLTPSIYLVAMYGVLFVIGMYIVPQFTSVVPLERWTGWAYAMYLMGQVAVGWTAPLLAVVALVLGALAVWALPRWSGFGRTWCDHHLFPFNIIAEISGFTWLVSYAALLRAGVADIDAIGAQMRAATPWLESRLRPIWTRVKNGLDLAAAMRAAGHDFPSADLIDEIGAYVEFPDFPAKIEAVARQYIVTLERRMRVVGGILSGVFTGLMFFSFVVLQLGANSISSLLSTSIGGN